VPLTVAPAYAPDDGIPIALLTQLPDDGGPAGGADDDEGADEDGFDADEDGFDADDDGLGADEDGFDADDDGLGADEDGFDADDDGLGADEDGFGAEDDVVGPVPDTPSVSASRGAPTPHSRERKEAKSFVEGEVSAIVTVELLRTAESTLNDTVLVLELVLRESRTFPTAGAFE
jgi:hypothetical protein